MERILEAIRNGDMEKAEICLQEYMREGTGYDDTTAILDAGIGAYHGDRMRVWEAIRKGLLHNCRDHELYVMLGEYYLPQDPDKAYLCYENALFYCDDPEDRKAILQFLYRLGEQYDVAVNRATIVILSCNTLRHTKLCIESIRMTTPESAREILVVDNASTDGSREWLREQADVRLLENRENVGFPVGCNQGIQAGPPENDIFLLNSDTILTANAFFWLRMGLYDKKQNGMAGSVSNYAKWQVADGIGKEKDLLAFGEKTNIPMRHACEDRPSLIGFALLIKREVIEQVGVLDERFSPGNYEDDDYSLRVLMAGYHNILCKNSFIIHFGNTSFKSNSMDLTGISRRNQQLLNQKWGFNAEYYLSPRQELVRLIEAGEEEPLHILDIGCGCGALMGKAKSLYPNAEVYGIELVPQVAEIASRMGKVLCGDIEKTELPWDEGYLDYIILGDVLEHLMDPEAVLKKLRRYLKDGGHIIVSMPNLKHFSVLLPLLQRDVFPYGDAGILDKTHVKLYTGTEIRKLLARSGYTIEVMNAIGTIKPDEKEEALIDILTAFMDRPDKTSFMTYQYIFKAVKDKTEDTAALG